MKCLFLEYYDPPGYEHLSEDSPRFSPNQNLHCVQVVFVKRGDRLVSAKVIRITDIPERPTARIGATRSAVGVSAPPFKPFMPSLIFKKNGHTSYARNLFVSTQTRTRAIHDLVLADFKFYFDLGVVILSQYKAAKGLNFNICQAYFANEVFEALRTYKAMTFTSIIGKFLFTDDVIRNSYIPTAKCRQKPSADGAMRKLNNTAVEAFQLMVQLFTWQVDTRSGGVQCWRSAVESCFNGAAPSVSARQSKFSRFHVPPGYEPPFNAGNSFCD